MQILFSKPNLRAESFTTANILGKFQFQKSLSTPKLKLVQDKLISKKEVNVVVELKNKQKLEKGNRCFQ